MTYDNIKSHKKPGLHPLSRICIFEKTTGGWGGGAEIDPYSSISKVRQSIFSSYVTINIYHT